MALKMSATERAAAGDTEHVPDCTEALAAWQHAYEQRPADEAFRHALAPLADRVAELLGTASGVFRSGLIDASEALAELIEDPMGNRIADRAPVLILIGEALGAVPAREAVAGPRTGHHVGLCPCSVCRRIRRDVMRTPNTAA